MARKAGAGKVTTTIVRDLPANGAVDEEIDPSTGEPLEAHNGEEFTEVEASPLDVLLDDLGGDNTSQLTVWSMNPGSPNGRVFCGPLPPGIHDSLTVMSEIQKKWGGGQYMVQIRGPSGTFSKRVIFEVAPPPKLEVPPEKLVQDSVHLAIRAAMEPMQQILASLAAQKQQPAFNMDKLVENALKLTPLLGIVQGFLRPANSAPQSSGGFDLQKFLEMKTQLDALGMGDRDPPAGAQVMQFLDKFGGPLMKALETAQPAAARAPNPRAPMPQNPAANPAANPPAFTVPPVAPKIDLTALTLPYVGTIVQMAQINMPPEQAAEAIVEALPEAMIDPICDAIEADQLVPALTRHPQLTGFKVWLGTVAAAMLDLLDGGEDEAVPSGDDMDGAGDDVPERGTAE